MDTIVSDTVNNFAFAVHFSNPAQPYCVTAAYVKALVHVICYVFLFVSIVTARSFVGTFAASTSHELVKHLLICTEVSI